MQCFGLWQLTREGHSTGAMTLSGVAECDPYAQPLNLSIGVQRAGKGVDIV